MQLTHKIVLSAMLSILFALSLTILVLSNISLRCIISHYPFNWNEVLRKKFCIPTTLTLMFSVLSIITIPALFLTPPLRSTHSRATGVTRTFAITGSVLHGINTILDLATVIYTSIQHGKPNDGEPGYISDGSVIDLETWACGWRDVFRNPKPGQVFPDWIVQLYEKECGVERGRRWLTVPFLALSVLAMGALIWGWKQEETRAVENRIRKEISDNKQSF